MGRYSGGAGLTDGTLEEELDDLDARVTAVEGGGGGGGPATAAELPFVPAGTIAANDVQAAVEEVATDAAAALAAGLATKADDAATTAALATKVEQPAGLVDGDMLVYVGGAIARAVEPTGFQSSNLADHYAAAVAGVAPGADDFVAVALCAPFTNREGTGNYVVAENVLGSTGWRIYWSYGALLVEAFDGGGALVQAGPGVNDYIVARAKGKLHAIALRARQVGGLLSIEPWLGPVRIGVAVAGAAGMDPAAGGTLKLGSSTIFDGLAFSGGVYGFGYKAGTMTDDEMRALMGRILRTGDVPTSMGLDLVYRGRDLAQGSPAGALWAPAVGAGNLARQGAPAGSRAYFPPV